MRRFSATDFLTAATVLAGASTSVAAALGEPQVQGIALGAAVALGSLLVRSVARDSNRAGKRQSKALDAVARQLSENTDKVEGKVAAVAKRLAGLSRRVELYDKRIERESANTTLRILSDINAARVEQVDATLLTGDN